MKALWEKLTPPLFQCWFQLLRGGFFSFLPPDWAGDPLVIGVLWGFLPLPLPQTPRPLFLIGEHNTEDLMGEIDFSIASYGHKSFKVDLDNY